MRSKEDLFSTLPFINVFFFSRNLIFYFRRRYWVYWAEREIQYVAWRSIATAHMRKIMRHLHRCRADVYDDLDDHTLGQYQNNRECTRGSQGANKMRLTTFN